MCTAVERAIGPDESPSPNGYDACIQEGGIEVDIDTFTDPWRVRMGIVEEWGRRCVYLRLVP